MTRPCTRACGQTVSGSHPLAALAHVPEPELCLCGPSLLSLLYVPLPKAWALAGGLSSYLGSGYVCLHVPQPSGDYAHLETNHVDLRPWTEKRTCCPESISRIWEHLVPSPTSHLSSSRLCHPLTHQGLLAVPISDTVLQHLFPQLHGVSWPTQLLSPSVPT